MKIRSVYFPPLLSHPHILLINLYPIKASYFSFNLYVSILVLIACFARPVCLPLIGFRKNYKGRRRIHNHTLREGEEDNKSYRIKNRYKGKACNIIMLDVLGTQPLAFCLHQSRRKQKDHFRLCALYAHFPQTTNIFVHFLYYLLTKLIWERSSYITRFVTTHNVRQETFYFGAS